LGGFVHKLKSSSSSPGATQVALGCNRLELACKENRETEIAETLPQLRQAVDSVMDFVQAWRLDPVERVKTESD
jgi:HPt (histidine-containing phosphotransfer) domain-containing protein